MRISISLLALSASLTLLSVGCSGPEQKFGRGVGNLTEFARLGEISRSMEQSALWDGSSKAYTTGFMRGFHRSMARTAVGVWEVATFPFPSYEPHLLEKNRLYPDYSIRTYTSPWRGLALPERPGRPDSFKPGLISDTIFSTDTNLGFSGGEVFPFIPGSRFRVFED